MCYQKVIYGMPYEFHGFEGVEAYLFRGGTEIKTLGNPALDSWFGYLQAAAVKKEVRTVIVANPYVEEGRAAVAARNDSNETAMLYAMTVKRDRSPILGQQANQLILLDYDLIKEKAAAQGSEVFMAVLLHESTHLLEQYLTNDLGIYNGLSPENRAGYHENVLLPRLEDPTFMYLRESAEYQKNYMGEEALTCLVEVLTFLHLKALADQSCAACFQNVIASLGNKLSAAVEIAHRDRYLTNI